jgi:hypothetical protein
MGKPFQLSPRRKFAAVTLFCLGVGLFYRVFIVGGLDWVPAIVGIFVSGAIAGVGLGILVRRPLAGAFVGAILTFFAVLTYFVWYFATHDRLF